MGKAVLPSSALERLPPELIADITLRLRLADFKAFRLTSTLLAQTTQPFLAQKHFIGLRTRSDLTRLYELSRRPACARRITAITFVCKRLEDADNFDLGRIYASKFGPESGTHPFLEPEALHEQDTIQGPFEEFNLSLVESALEQLPNLVDVSLRWDVVPYEGPDYDAIPMENATDFGRARCDRDLVLRAFLRGMRRCPSRLEKLAIIPLPDYILPEILGTLPAIYPAPRPGVSLGFEEMDRALGSDVTHLGLSEWPGQSFISVTFFTVCLLPRAAYDELYLGDGDHNQDATYQSDYDGENMGGIACGHVRRLFAAMPNLEYLEVTSGLATRCPLNFSSLRTLVLRCLALDFGEFPAFLERQSTTLRDLQLHWVRGTQDSESAKPRVGWVDTLKMAQKTLSNLQSVTFSGILYDYDGESLHFLHDGSEVFKSLHSLAYILHDETCHFMLHGGDFPKLHRIVPRSARSVWIPEHDDIMAPTDDDGPS